METKRIAELLDKYYRGETTLEEERQLKSFFQQEDTPEELQADKDVFLLYTGLAQQPVDLPEGLEERLSASIGRWQKESQRRRPWLRPSIRLWSIGIAASLLIAAGMGIYLQKSEPKQHDTFTNPALAYQETQRRRSYRPPGRAWELKANGLVLLEFPLYGTIGFNFQRSNNFYNFQRHIKSRT